MSAGKDDLFRLIQSMSKSEKRYFKMESKKAGDKTSNHIKFFDAINDLEEYDEGVLKKKLRKEKFIAHLSAEKRYLYKAVLRSIRNFRGDQSVFAQIKTLVIDANYLSERSLNDQAKKILDKAGKLAAKIDDTVSLLEINLKKQQLSIADKIKEHQQNIEFLMKEKNEIIHLLMIKLELRDIYNKIGAANTENNHAQILDLIQGRENILDQAQNTNSFYATLWHHAIMANYYKSLGELEKLSEMRTNIVELWNQYPDIKKESFHTYLLDLANISASYFKQNQIETAFKYLQLLENEKPVNAFDRVLVFEKVTIKKLIYFMSKGNFDEAQSLVPGIESTLEKISASKSTIITIKINIAILYFCVENFHVCLTWVNKIINTPKSKIRIDIQGLSRLLAIVAQIEIGESYETIDNFCRSTQRFFQKNNLKNNNQESLILLDYFWKYYISSQKQKTEILDQFKLTIEEFRSHPTKKLTLGLEEFHYWIRSKLEKKSIARLIKESNSTRD